jgi:uncharacterized protein involved in type VI secretion and phage assembly
MNGYYANGPVFGIIADNADPEGKGRVKVMLDFLGDNICTDWIPLMVQNRGEFVLPEIDDQVVVAFLGDDADKAVVLGTIWSEAQMPPETGVSGGSELNKDKKNNLRFLRSRAGHRVVLNDTAGSEAVQVITADGKTKIEMSAKEKKVTVKTGMDITVSSAKKIIINCESISVKAKKGAKIEGDEILTQSKGKDVNIKAGKNVGVEGSGINLN